MAPLPSLAAILSRSDSCFDLVSVLPKARQAPEVIPHASPRDRVETIRRSHYVQQSTRTIFETLGTVHDVLGIAAIQEGRQFGLRSGTACQAPKDPSNPGKGIWVILCA